MNGANSRFKPQPTADGSAPAASNGWVFPESQLPTRDRSNGHSPMFTIPTNGFADSSMLSAGRPVGFVDEIQDMSTSPDDGLSSRPTPNSSSASESRQNLAPPQPQGGMHSAGSSFDTSPVSPSRGHMGGQQATGVDQGTAGGYFTSSGTATFGTGQPGASAAGVAMNGGAAGLGGLMSTDPSSADYMMPEGWNLNGQTAMTPVSEGVLRTIINMGPMETMDLGWGSNP